MKFQGSNKRRFGSFEEDRYFLKILKWEHKFIPKYNQGKLLSCF